MYFYPQNKHVDVFFSTFFIFIVSHFIDLFIFVSRNNVLFAELLMLICTILLTQQNFLNYWLKIKKDLECVFLIFRVETKNNETLSTIQYMSFMEISYSNGVKVNHSFKRRIENCWMCALYGAIFFHWLNFDTISNLYMAVDRLLLLEDEINFFKRLFHSISNSEIDFYSLVACIYQIFPLPIDCLWYKFSLLFNVKSLPEKDTQEEYFSKNLKLALS